MPVQERAGPGPCREVLGAGRGTRSQPTSKGVHRRGSRRGEEIGGGLPDPAEFRALECRHRALGALGLDPVHHGGLRPLPGHPDLPGRGLQDPDLLHGEHAAGRRLPPGEQGRLRRRASGDRPPAACAGRAGARRRGGLPPTAPAGQELREAGGGNARRHPPDAGQGGACERGSPSGALCPLRRSAGRRRPPGHELAVEPPHRESGPRLSSHPGQLGPPAGARGELLRHGRQSRQQPRQPLLRPGARAQYRRQGVRGVDALAQLHPAAAL